MILAAIFCVFAVVAVIRLAVYARFTAQSGNMSGAVMLWSLTAVIIVCLVLAVIRL